MIPKDSYHLQYFPIHFPGIRQKVRTNGCSNSTGVFEESRIPSIGWLIFSLAACIPFYWDRLALLLIAHICCSPYNVPDGPIVKCPDVTLPPPPPFSKSWNCAALKQLAGSKLGICLLGVSHHLGILTQDSLFRVRGHQPLGLCSRPPR